jgi:hypothetical protein
MSNNVRKVLIALVVALSLVAAALAYVRFFGPKEAVPGETAATGTTSGLPSSPGLPEAGTTAEVAAGGQPALTFTLPTIVRASAEEVLVNELTIAARDFAERYGSYSTDGDFRNLETLLPSMTDVFAAETRDTIARGRASASAGAFVGVTTKALSVRPEGVISAEGPVSVTVVAQRTAVGGSSPGVSYEELDLVMRYTDGVWKTASAAWRKG